MSQKEKIICQRCKNNQILFCCNSCPKPFDKLCSECDTYVHSIIPYKKVHNRTKIDNFFNNNNTHEEIDLKLNKLNIIQKENNINEKLQKEIKELKEKSNFQIDTINKLKLENDILKNDIMKLVEQNKALKKENEEYQKEINYIKLELEKCKNDNISIKKDLNKSILIINELNNNLRNLNNNINIKENEIEELKIYFDKKLNKTNDEKEYLLKVLDNSNYKLIEKNDISFQLKEENEILKKRVILFEQENIDNLKLISQLHKENKELIHRINTLKNNKNLY